jgi:serine protease inhibitor ecotin
VLRIRVVKLKTDGSLLSEKLRTGLGFSDFLFQEISSVMRTICPVEVKLETEVLKMYLNNEDWDQAETGLV